MAEHSSHTSGTVSISHTVSFTSRGHQFVSGPVFRLAILRAAQGEGAAGGQGIGCLKTGFMAKLKAILDTRMRSAILIVIP